MTVLACLASEQLPCQDLYAHRGGAFAHSDQHDTSTEDVDVSSFERGRLVTPIVAAVVDREGRLAEHRMEPIHGSAMQRLALAGGFRHRVDGDAVVDPSRVVALKQRVRERGEDEVFQSQGLPAQASRAAAATDRNE